jgi:hypothetical protein
MVMTLFVFWFAAALALRAPPLDASPCAVMASEGANMDVHLSGAEPKARSRSPYRGEPTPILADETSLELTNLPEQGPHVYTYHHGPESDNFARNKMVTRGYAEVWDPRGGGAITLRLKSTGASQSTGMMVSSEAVPGGTPGADSSGGAAHGVGGIGGDSGDGGGGGAPDGGGGGGSGGGGQPPWDENACSLHPFPGSTPVSVRFAEVVHWRQRAVYCRPDATVDNVKWTMRHTVGQHVSTFRIGDGFSGHPLARHWYVTGQTANTVQNFQEPRRVLVVMPSFI